MPNPIPTEDLDAALARAKGWNEWTTWPDDYDGPFPMWTKGNDGIWKYTAPGTSWLWSPSTDIADAMGELEGFDDWEVYRDPSAYGCIIWLDRETDTLACADSATKEEAITRAVLAALSQKEEAKCSHSGS